jgi:hypothetical protein
MDGFHLIQGDTTPDEYLTDQSKPQIEPGQIWLVECIPGALSTFHVGLLAHANVVLYERGLGAALAEALPLGLYAEPLPAALAAGPALAPRARYFAAEGWRVVQFVERGDGWRRRLRAALMQPDPPGSGVPLLAIGTITASRYRPRHETSADLVVARLAADELLSLTFAAPAVPAGPAGLAFTANGLAG